MRTRSLYFENRAEYYRLKEAGLDFKIQVETTFRHYKTYFINFEIADTRGYVVGSLSSPKRIKLVDAKKIIKANIPIDYIPVNFYDAVENERQDQTKLVLMREDDEILEVNFGI